MVSIDVKRNVASKEYLRIVWDIFFKKKARGVSLLTHFPWLYNKTLNYISFEIKSGNEYIGGLVVVEKEINNLKVGLVGLVCIDEAYQGKGFFKLLMQSAMNQCLIDDFSALFLWTSKHQIYEKYGFEILDDNILVKVTSKYNKKTNNHGIDKNKYHNDIITNEQVDLAVPPFAREVYKLKAGELSILYCTSDNSKYIISYDGDISEVLDLFCIFSDGVFFINSTKNKKDEFMNLDNKKYILDIEDQKIQMVRFFDQATSDQIQHINFSVHERI